MFPLIAWGAVLTRLSSVGEEPVVDTLGKINRCAGFANSASSIKLKLESNTEKKPFTAGVEADISTQPVCPEIPVRNNSDARDAICPDPGRVSVTGLTTWAF